MTYEIIHTGKIFSNNDAISKHWRTNQGIKSELKKSFTYQIRARRMAFMQTFSVNVEANTRHDIDNLSMTVKIFNDCLKKCGVIKDDAPKYFKSLSITHNPEIEKGSLKITIYGE